MSKEPLYIIFHVPKTGGTSFRFQLKRFFRNDQVLFLYRDFYSQINNKEKVKDLINALTPGQKRKIKVIIGHKVYYGIDELFSDREIRYVIFFRHPAARIVSRYNFSRTLLAAYPDHYKLDDVIKEGRVVAFSEFVKNASFCRNSMYRFFLEHGMGSSDSSIEQNLSGIKSILKTFYFVGLTEKSSEDFLFLFHQLGLNPLALRLNASKKFFKPDDDLTEKLRTGNEIDYQLYDWAVLLNQKIKDESFYRIIRKMRIKKIINAPYFAVLFLFFGASEFLRKKSKRYAQFLDKISNYRYRGV